VVERPPVMSPQPRRPRRQRLTPRQLALRRGAALFAVLVVIGFLAWAAAAIVGSLSGGTAQNVIPTLPPAPKPLKIIFPEGFSRLDMAERITAVNKIAVSKRNVHPRLSANAYLAATQSSTLPSTFAHDHKRRSLEGFLFPATYDFAPRTTSAQLVKAQLAAFRTNWAKLDLAYAKSKNLTPYDVLTIAAMVEKETLAPDERRLVAAVIYNRLHDGMTLGIDATLRYGLHIPPTESIHQSQLDNPTPYNTRLHSGLPPTPIANPGLASLRAAAHPAKVNYLFYARKADHKHHFFTASDAEFQQFLATHGYG
jgi:uncharacterized YceG family protein